MTRPARLLPAFLAASGLLIGCGAASAQPASRVAVNVPALLSFPAFYHARSIVVRGELVAANDRTVLRDLNGDRRVEVVIKSGRRAEGQVEVRGVFWDIGRMTAEDPRFAGFEIQAFLDARTGGAWLRVG